MQCMLSDNKHRALDLRCLRPDQQLALGDRPLVAGSHCERSASSLPSLSDWVVIALRGFKQNPSSTKLHHSLSSVVDACQGVSLQSFPGTRIWGPLPTTFSKSRVLPAKRAWPSRVPRWNPIAWKTLPAGKSFQTPGQRKERNPQMLEIRSVGATNSAIDG